MFTTGSAPFFHAERVLDPQRPYRDGRAHCLGIRTHRRGESMSFSTAAGALGTALVTALTSMFVMPRIAEPSTISDLHGLKVLITNDDSARGRDAYLGTD